MKRLLLLACVLTVGCVPMTPPVLRVPLGQAALVYADFHAAAAVLELRVKGWCRDGVLTETDCAVLAEQWKQAKAVDKEIRKGILAAQGEIDWEKVIEYAEIIAGIVGKVGKAAL